MQTWHIHIQGQVQGVGFRPFVYLLARKYGVHGWVNNTVDGVHVAFNAAPETAELFHQDLLKRAPKLSVITGHQLQEIAPTSFADFQIIQSEQNGTANLLVTPDFAICPDCKTELQTDHNRREGYAFITCTNCGPRYSIIAQLPYDRPRTTMDAFEMCPTCLAEYEAPADRRYYSQTNSCANCGIELTLVDQQHKVINEAPPQIIDQVVTAWNAGKIIAIKGIGGYLLTCDARNAQAITTLRERKHRPSKPFALMFPDLESLQSLTNIIPAEAELMTGPIAPIILVDSTEEVKQVLAMPEIAPGLSQVGAMLPYAPIFVLLLKKFGQPIVATSGNISNAPIVFQDEKAKTELATIADYILVNNRKIVVPQDDSVVRFTPFKHQKIVIRRSRGMAPTYINGHLQLPQQSMLAMGAMLKSTFSLLHGGNAYISQYLGDLEHFDTQENYRKAIQHFLQLFQTIPTHILLDLHPEYPSTKYGQLLAQKFEIPTTSVQHHLAHFGAVLGEHHLLQTEEPILGVIWDGTGLGDDGQIWGGEFFKYEQYDFLRCYYFDYFDFILGDKMPKEPRISALSACWDVMGAAPFLRGKFTQTEWQVYEQLLSKTNHLQTSSVGRIFDAVAALLGLMDVQTYEGEAAIKLEALATQYFKQNGLDFHESYFREGAHYYRIPTKTMMTALIMDLQKGKTRSFIAAKFHFSLVKLVKIVANNLNIKKIAFSGGVFQNALLVDLLAHHLSADFDLYFHEQLSPNDENISFGQLMYTQIQALKLKQNHHVFSDSR